MNRLQIWIQVILIHAEATASSLPLDTHLLAPKNSPFSNPGVIPHETTWLNNMKVLLRQPNTAGFWKLQVDQNENRMVFQAKKTCIQIQL